MSPLVDRNPILQVMLYHAKIIHIVVVNAINGNVNE